MERFQRGLVAVILVVISLATAHCAPSAGLPPTATSIPAATAVPTLTPAPSTPTPSVLLRAVPQDLPKGQRVILYNTRGNELGLLDVEKGTHFPLVELEGNGGLGFVRASPTGDSIAFELTESAPLPRQQEFSLWRLDLQSHRVELLWEGNTLMKNDFAWAPDGRTIVVSLLDYAKCEEMFQGVWLVDVTTKERKPLIQPMVKLSTDGFVWVYRWPVWSPQGDRIAINGGYDGHESFGYAYVMGAESGSLRLLSERGLVDGWSPDGSQVLVNPNSPAYSPFVSWVEWILSADGQELGRFVAAEDWDDVGGMWSPDGKRAYFYSQKAVQEGTMDLSLLWNVLIDRPLRLSLTDVFPRPWGVGSALYHIPTPSGAKLVFNQYDEESGAYSIWAVDIASGTRMNLGDGFAWDVFVVRD